MKLPRKSIEIDIGLWYDPATGDCWSTRKRGQRGKGYVPGKPKQLFAKNKKNGYLRVLSSDKELVYWHVLVYEFFKGSGVQGLTVDHKDGNRMNNLKTNLQVLTNTDNVRKRHKQINNTSGRPGVWWNKKNKNWNASIRVYPRSIFLGCFATRKEAYKAFIDAKVQYHGTESIAFLRKP